MTTGGPYSPDAASAGRRALNNICLDLLAATAESHAIRLAASQYQTADNMTDRMAALATLTQHDVPERSAALEDFYQRYRDDPLTLDKWFALQATAPHASHARPGARAHRAPGLLDVQSQPRALADHRVRGRQPDPVQPAGRRRLRLHRRHRAGARRPPIRRSRRACCPRSRAGACSSRAGARAPKPRCAASPRNHSLSRDVSDIAQRALAERLRCPLHAFADISY